MKLRMNLEIETEGMTLLQLAALVDGIKHASGAKGRVKCSLGRAMSHHEIQRDVDISELLSQPAMR